MLQSHELSKLIPFDRHSPIAPWISFHRRSDPRSCPGYLVEILCRSDMFESSFGGMDFAMREPTTVYPDRRIWYFRLYALRYSCTDVFGTATIVGAQNCPPLTGRFG